MTSALLLVFVSFALATVLTPLFGRYFRRRGWVDYPDNHRKLHRRPIPRPGGVPIFLSVVLAYALLSGVGIVRAALSPVLALLPAALVILLVGLWDDIKGLSPTKKLIGQVVGASLACAAGLRVTGFDGFRADSIWSLLLSIGWIVACTNAVNLVDGLDGLAAGLGMFASLTVLLAGIVYHDMSLVIVTAPLAGALLGFLRFNFRPARIFLGDSGSLFIGFLLGCFGVLWSQKATTILGLTAPLILMIIPIADTALAVVRRYLRKRPIFGADRGHLHHRLLDHGFSATQVVLLLYAVSGLAAALSLAQSVVQQRFAPVVILLFCALFSVGLWAALSRLGYLEIGLAARLLLHGRFNRSNLNLQLSLAELERSLSSAVSVDECFAAIAHTSELFGFSTVSLDVQDRCYHATFNAAGEDHWNVSIPISGSENILLCRDFSSSQHESSVLSFFRVLRAVLPAKLAAIRNGQPVEPTPGGDRPRLLTPVSF